MNLIIYQLMSKITWIEWWWNTSYMHKWSCFVKRIWRSLNQTKIKLRINSSSRVSLQDTSFGVILVLVGLKKSTNEPNLYKNCFQRHDETQDKYTFEIFVLPINNAKTVEEMGFHIDAAMLKYCESTSYSCCFGNLAS